MDEQALRSMVREAVARHLVGPAAAAAQAVEIALHRRVMSVSGSPVPVDAQTLCVHGDTPNAPSIAAAVRRELEAHGFRIRAAG